MDLTTPFHHTWTYQALAHDVLVSCDSADSASIISVFSSLFCRINMNLPWCFAAEGEDWVIVSSIQRPVVDEANKWFQWLGSLLLFPSGDRLGIWPIKDPMMLIPRRSPPEQLEEEDWGRTGYLMFTWKNRLCWCHAVLLVTLVACQIWMVS